MADTKISQLPPYPSGRGPTVTDLLLVIDTSDATYVSRQANLSAVSNLASGYDVIQAQSGVAVTQRQIVQFVGSGVASVVDDPANNRTVVTITGGGGGGGQFTSTVRWTTANSANKNAYSSPGVINNDGITISLVASSGSGAITNATVSLNGTPLTNLYISSGTFPNYTITVPVTDIGGIAAQTAATVVVSIVGAFSGNNFNITNAGTLTNNQPIPFTTTLSGSYSPNTLPFYTETATINYSYSNSSAITAFNGVITPTGGSALNADAAIGTFTGQPIAGAQITGQATGNGQFNAGSATVNLSGSIAAVSTFTPAWFSQTASNAPPLFQTTDPVAPTTPLTNTNYQTAGAAQGSRITYPVASASNQYNWICTQRPLANIALVTPFGNSPLVPDVTDSQTLGGQVFQIYGFTRLSTNVAAVLVIS